MRRVHHLATEGNQDYPHIDALVIETNVAGWIVTMILINTGRFVDILFTSTFDSMKLGRNLLQPASHPVYGFGGIQVMAIGKISLPVTFGN
jgi:hypothetical protein